MSTENVPADMNICQYHWISYQGDLSRIPLHGSGHPLHGIILVGSAVDEGYKDNTICTHTQNDRPFPHSLWELLSLSIPALTSRLFQQDNGVAVRFCFQYPSGAVSHSPQLSWLGEVWFPPSVFKAMIHIYVSLTECPAHARKASAELLSTPVRELTLSALQQSRVSKPGLPRVSSNWIYQSGQSFLNSLLCFRM